MASRRSRPSATARRCRALPVIVLSAVTEEAAVRKVLQLGVGDYLAKPLYPMQITNRLSRFVSTLAPPVTTPSSSAGSGRRLVAPMQPGARVLVADGDANYRQFVREMLGGEFTLSEATTGAAALHACVQTPPALVLLGEGLGPLDAERVATKLRTLAETTAGAAVRRLAATQRRRARGVEEVRRRADSHVRARRVPRAVGADGRLDPEGPREFEIDPQLKRQLVSTVEQVFGMMLGIEIEPVDGSPVPAEEQLVGRRRGDRAGRRQRDARPHLRRPGRRPAWRWRPSSDGPKPRRRRRRRRSPGRASSPGSSPAGCRAICARAAARRPARRWCRSTRAAMPARLEQTPERHRVVQRDARGARRSGCSSARVPRSGKCRSQRPTAPAA